MSRLMGAPRQPLMHPQTPTLPSLLRLLWFVAGLLLAWCSLIGTTHAQTLRSSPMLTELPDESAVRAYRLLNGTEPASAAETQPTLGLGDQLQITVFGQPDMSAEVTVGDTGTIMLPLVGNIKVADLTSAQIETLIANRLREGGYLQNPSVAVQIRQIRSQMISVLGEVQRPGRFPLQGRMTVLEAVASAGGMTQRADRKLVVLRRTPNGKASESQRLEIGIQLDQPSASDRAPLDMALQNDDVVFVGAQKLFYVHGEVRRPGAYPMEPGLNVMKALSLSGGVSERGSIKRIRLHRLDAQKVLREVKAEPAMPLQADDVLFVEERLF